MENDFEVLGQCRKVSVKPGELGSETQAAFKLYSADGLADFLSQHGVLRISFHRATAAETASVTDKSDPDQERIEGMETAEEKRLREKRRAQKKTSRAKRSAA